MEKKIKVMMLMQSLAGGGAERVASELDLNFSPNFDNRIVTLMNEVSYPSKQPPIKMNFNNQNTFINNIRIFVLGSIKYRKLLNKHNPSISLSFLVLDNFINIISNLGRNDTKTIISSHIALSMKFGNSLYDRAIKYFIKCLYNKSDCIIAVSNGVRDELIKDFGIMPHKIRVLYNPVDINKIKLLSCEEVNDENWFDEDVPIIITVGRLTKQKGQWHLIRAFSKVSEKINCRLVIRGDGELKNYLESLIDSMGLNEKILFLEWKDNPFKYISKSTLFASSSLWEALPYALTETMACGCPVISTDCKYGPKEILGEDEYGLLVPSMTGVMYSAFDPLTSEENVLANKIIDMLTNKKTIEHYSKKAIERSSYFAVETCVKKYESLFSILVNDLYEN